MPIWVEPLIQFIEYIIGQLINHPPAPSAPQSEQDAHAASLAKAQAVRDLLNA